VHSYIQNTEAHGAKDDRERMRKEASIIKAFHGPIDAERENHIVVCCMVASITMKRQERVSADEILPLHRQCGATGDQSEAKPQKE
jgi:hypothetical protein